MAELRMGEDPSDRGERSDVTFVPHLSEGARPGSERREESFDVGVAGPVDAVGAELRHESSTLDGPIRHQHRELVVFEDELEKVGGVISSRGQAREQALLRGVPGDEVPAPVEQVRGVRLQRIDEHSEPGRDLRRRTRRFIDAVAGQREQVVTLRRGQVQRP